MADTRTDNLEQLARELVELARGVTIAAAPFLAASTGPRAPRRSRPRSRPTAAHFI